MFGIMQFAVHGLGRTAFPGGTACDAGFRSAELVTLSAPGTAGWSVTAGSGRSLEAVSFRESG